MAGRRTFLSLSRHRNYRLFFAGQLASVSARGCRTSRCTGSSLADALAARGRVSVARASGRSRFRPPRRNVADRLDNRTDGDGDAAVQMVLVVHPRRDHARSATSRRGTSTRSRSRGGSALVLDAPSRQSLTFQMVGRDELPNAVALNSSLFNTARILGPALAGVVIAAVGSGWCFFLNGLSFTAVLASLARDARRRAPPARAPRHGRRSGRAPARGSRSRGGRRP